MNINDLRYFKKLAEVQNFSKTARFFKISQPTVTYAVKRLEEEFGTNLLIHDPHSHSFLLSKTGEQLLSHITKILFEIDVAKQDIKELEDSKLKVGFPPIITNYFSYLFSALQEKHIFNKIDAVSGESRSLMNKLISGKIDITLIGSLQPINNTDLNSFLLATHKFKIISAKENILSLETSISLSNILNEHFIMLDEKSIHNKAFSKLTLSLNRKVIPTFKTDDYKLAMNLIKDNNGIGFFTETAISKPNDFNIYDIKEAENLRFYIYLVYRKNKFVSEDMQKFINLFKTKKS